ncbi:MAG: 3-oxoadipate enol-lactonase [Hyphomicrobiaceae bacterium]|jgi:3-oxoadipate enol-lactonase
MTIETINVGAAEIAYELSGPVGAPVVLLSHCFCADHAFWNCHLKACSGFQILRYDTRGHGQSSRPPGPYTLDQLAGDVVALLDGLKIQKVHFAGVSMGGMIGQTLALSYPERLASLALVNTTPQYSDAQRVAWRERATVALEQGMEAIHEGLMNRWFTDEAIATGNAGYKYMVEAVSRFSPQSFDAVTAAMCQLDTTERLRYISAPTLVVGAPEDPGVPPELTKMLATEIPDAELHWLTPARHLATLEHTTTFNELLSSHLARNASN